MRRCPPRSVGHVHLSTLPPSLVGRLASRKTSCVSPAFACLSWFTPLLRVVGLGGFEPPTPRLSSVCSNQLSYRPGRNGAACL